MSSSATHFSKQALPPGRTFYERELGKLSRPSRGWARTRCVFHGGNNATALSVNLDTGGFYCFNCGAKGGDLVDFVMLRDHVDFKTAAASLGAWNDGPIDTAALNRARSAREAQNRAEESLAERISDLRRDYVHEIHLYRDMMAANLADSETVDRLRQTLAAHAIVSFARSQDVARFLAGDTNTRNQMCEQVLIDGYVMTDEGKPQDVRCE